MSNSECGNIYRIAELVPAIVTGSGKLELGVRGQ